MMWKDWFYYTKGERRAIILLSVVLVVIVVVAIVKYSSVKPFMVNDNTQALADSLMRKVQDAERNSAYGSVKQVKKQYSGSNRDTASSSAGRSFVKPIYKKQEKFPEGTVIDLNTADTTTLKKIPGIGSVISSRIVRYRERLGGFYDIHQLLEVKYTDSLLLGWFKIETGVYRKLRINTDGLETLKKHPYMGYSRAKAVIEYRKKRGKIDDISQLSMLEEFDSDTLDRLRRYIDFQ